jgi:RNA-directed DNA polymerase
MFLKDLREHLCKYGLELNEEKTRLIRFGRFARQNREERGEGKPESFTFLTTGEEARSVLSG